MLVLLNADDETNLIDDIDITTRIDEISENQDRLEVPPEADYICLCLDRDPVARREDGESYLVRDRVRAEGVALRKNHALPASLTNC